MGLLLHFILCIELIAVAYFDEVYILQSGSKISGTDLHSLYSTLVSFALMYVLYIFQHEVMDKGPKIPVYTCN